MVDPIETPQTPQTPQQPDPSPAPEETGDAADATDPELQNEGEGSRTAARRYDEHVEKAAKDEKHVEELAKEAAKALEGPEGDELRRADERGMHHEHK